MTYSRRTTTREFTRKIITAVAEVYGLLIWLDLGFVAREYAIVCQSNLFTGRQTLALSILLTPSNKDFVIIVVATSPSSRPGVADGRWPQQA
jgi:hypothetical protein